MTSAHANKYCRSTDLSNEASVEAFFVLRLLQDLGYRDGETVPKRSIQELRVPRGHAREPYKPDFLLKAGGKPRWVLDAKSVDEQGICLPVRRLCPAHQSQIQRIGGCRCGGSHRARLWKAAVCGNGRKPGQQGIVNLDRKVGFFVSFDYTRDAETEVRAFKRKSGREIRLLTVREILDDQTARPPIRQ